VVARGEHLAAIRAKGLTLETPCDRFTVRIQATAEPAELGPQGLVIVTAKTTAFPAVAQSIGPLLGPETAVLFAVNGVFWFYAHGFAPGGVAPDLRRLDPEGTLHRLIGVERAIGGVVHSPNEVVEPGSVHNGRVDDNRFVLGEPGPGPVSPRLKAIAAALDGAGFIVDTTDDIRRAMWLKLIRNVASAPVACLSGADGQRLAKDPDLRKVAATLMRETLDVAEAHGFTGSGIDPEAELAKPRFAHKPSILQDLERGRPMEIDTMLRAVQDLARQSRVPTPTLDTLLPILILRAQLAGCYPAS